MISIFKDIKLAQSLDNGFVIWCLSRRSLIFNLSVRKPKPAVSLFWSLPLWNLQETKDKGQNHCCLSSSPSQGGVNSFLLPSLSFSLPFSWLPLQNPDIYEVAPNLFAPHSLPTSYTPSLTSTRVLRTSVFHKVSEILILVYILVSLLSLDLWRSR